MIFCDFNMTTIIYSLCLLILLNLETVEFVHMILCGLKNSLIGSTNPLCRISGVTKIFLRGRVPYNHNQICLVKKFFKWLKKGFHFEPVPVLSIFRPKNLVMSKDVTLNLSPIFRISDFQRGPWHNAPTPLNSLLCRVT